MTWLGLKSRQKTSKSSVPWSLMPASMPTHYLNRISWMLTSLSNLSNTVCLRWAAVPANGLGSVFSQRVLAFMLRCFCSLQTPGLRVPPEHSVATCPQTAGLLWSFFTAGEGIELFLRTTDPKYSEDFQCMNSQELSCVQTAHIYSSKCSWANLGQLNDSLANPLETPIFKCGN